MTSSTFTLRIRTCSRGSSFGPIAYSFLLANPHLPSSTAQAIAFVLLNKWGLEGFYAHTLRVAAFYKEKRDMFERAAHKHLDGLATWVTPDSGMFVSSLPPFLLPSSLQENDPADDL